MSSQQLGLESFRVSLRHKKNQTAACDFCKKRKIKCDGKRPCFNCSFRSLDCVYSKQAKRGRRSATAKPDSLLDQLQPRLTIQQEHNAINISLAPTSPSSFSLSPSPTNCNGSPPPSVPSPKDSSTNDSSSSSSSSAPSSPTGEVECIQREPKNECTIVGHLVQQHHLGTVAERIQSFKEFSAYLRGWLTEIVMEDEVVSPKTDAQRSQLLAVMATTTRIKGDLRRAHNLFLQSLALARTVFDEVSDDSATAMILVGSYFPLHHPKSFIYSSLAATIAGQMHPTLRRSRLIKLSVLISNMSDRGSTGVHKYASILKHTASKNEQMPELYDTTLNLLMHIFANLALKFNVFWDINNAILIKKMHFSDGERDELMRRITLGESILSTNYKDTSTGMVLLFKIFKVLVLWRGGSPAESSVAAREALDYCYNNSIELFFATDLTTLMVLVWYFKDTCDYHSLYRLEDLIRRLSTLTNQPEYLDYLSPEFAAHSNDSMVAIDSPIAHPSPTHETSLPPLPLPSPYLIKGSSAISKSTPNFTSTLGDTTHNYNSIIINSNINVESSASNPSSKANQELIQQLQDEIQQLRNQIHTQQPQQNPPSPQVQEVPRQQSPPHVQVQNVHHLQHPQLHQLQMQQQQQHQHQLHMQQQGQSSPFAAQPSSVSSQYHAQLASNANANSGNNNNNGNNQVTNYNQSPFGSFQDHPSPSAYQSALSQQIPTHMMAGASFKPYLSSLSSPATAMPPLQSHFPYMPDPLMGTSLDSFLSDAFPLGYDVDA